MGHVAQPPLERAAAHRLREPDKIEFTSAVEAAVNGTIDIAQKQRGGESSHLPGVYGTPQALGGEVLDRLEYLT
jgi:hypothetical protein